MRILIKYASRGRPEMFKQAINNIEETIGYNDYRVIVSCDYQDYSMNNDIIKDFCKTKRNVDIFFGANSSKIEAINADMDWVGGWDMLVNMSDDMHFVKQGWATSMINDIRGVWGNGLDFFAHFNDGYVADRLPTMSVFGREYGERFFYIYPPCYKSVSCDAEAMYVAKMLGKHHYFPSVYFHHRHPANGAARIDDVYIMNNRHGDYDTNVYFRRLKKMFYVNNPTVIPNEMKPYL